MRRGVTRVEHADLINIRSGPKIVQGVVAAACATRVSGEVVLSREVYVWSRGRFISLVLPKPIAVLMELPRHSKVSLIDLYLKLIELKCSTTLLSFNWLRNKEE